MSSSSNLRSKKRSADSEIGSQFGIESSSRRSRGENHDSEMAMLELAMVIHRGDKVVFVTGAGLSVASGIPPFRGQHDAVWEQSVHTWGTRAKFEDDPLSWYNVFWLHHFDESKAKGYKPNQGHEAIASICTKYPNVTVITQNIDRLHRHTTGKIDDEQLIEVHGFTGAYKCFTEDCPYSNSELVNASLLECIKSVSKGKSEIRDSKNLPHCPSCNSIMCPNCLLFDEDYSDHSSYQFEKACEWLKAADAIVFVGTSFAVKITDIAFASARNKVPHAMLFNVNLHHNVSKAKVSKTPVGFLKGKSEEILPKLWTMLEDWSKC